MSRLVELLKENNPNDKIEVDENQLWLHRREELGTIIDKSGKRIISKELVDFLNKVE